MTLEQLAVVSAPQISFDERVPERLTVEFTPTVPHCGMSTFIGTSVLSAVGVFATDLNMRYYRSLNTNAPVAQSTAEI